MTFYVAIHRPGDLNHSKEITQEVMDDIDQVNQEMVDAGIRLIVGGLRNRAEAKSVNRADDEGLTVIAWPYLQTEGYVDGFWVLDLPTMDEAVEWGKKAAAACRGSVEVRPFHGS
jgi:hypothetical protein